MIPQLAMRKNCAVSQFANRFLIQFVSSTSFFQSSIRAVIQGEKRPSIELGLRSLLDINKCWRKDWIQLVCNATRCLLNLDKQEKENCSRRFCQNTAQSVGNKSCVNTPIPCQLSAHVLHLSHVPAERAFVLLGSLSEQTEHKEAAIGLSVCLSDLFVLQLQPAGNTPGTMHIILSARWLTCVLTYSKLCQDTSNEQSWKFFHLVCEITVCVTLTRQPLESTSLGLLKLLGHKLGDK